MSTPETLPQPVVAPEHVREAGKLATDMYTDHKTNVAEFNRADEIVNQSELNEIELKSASNALRDYTGDEYLERARDIDMRAEDITYKARQDRGSAERHIDDHVDSLRAPDSTYYTNMENIQEAALWDAAANGETITLSQEETAKREKLLDADAVGDEWEV